MSRIYMDLDTIAHLFYAQNILEKEHREKNYHEESLKNVLRLEVQSTLFHLFSKILFVAEMSNPVSDYKRKQLLDKVNMRLPDSSSKHCVLK